MENAGQDGQNREGFDSNTFDRHQLAGGITKIHGILDVDVIVGSKELKIAFFVIDTTSTTYNALLGRDWIHQSLCVPSTLHQQLALWNDEGHMEIVEADPRHSYPLPCVLKQGIIMTTSVLLLSLESTRTAAPMVSRPKGSLKKNPATNMAEFTHESAKEQEEEVLDFAPAASGGSSQEINLGTEEDPRPTFISTLLKEPLKSELIALLQEFRDCFAWHYHEMPGLDRQLEEHKLPIKDGYLPVKQARRRMSMDTELKVKEEIERLLKAGFIRPAIYDISAKSIMEALPPRNKRELQSLLGKINFLRRFISNSAGKIQPFSSLLRLNRNKTFKWEEQHQQAFQEIKDYLSNPPVCPTKERQTTQALCICIRSFYWRFIQNFSAIARPLNNLLEKDAKFDWN
ncbi:hypothetical protein Prudu_1505S000100 [Prunus dulcis]|uniref:Transposable element protein n=1 Tax=Prunus dulcis TaxID=3755 RepID=A0A5H2XW74_PRUDU|nr:hypothetical protein Prudu_1505S000100 [Prunus dulcis]